MSPKPLFHARKDRNPKTSAFLSDFRDLQVGDYVVHVEHGIGQYQGLKRSSGRWQRRVHAAEYAEGARLYVPAHGVLTWSRSIDRQKVPQPPLSHLGTAAGPRREARVRKAMKNGDELLKLYAERKPRRPRLLSR